jgi:cell wall-associated NlpC family hydrolase
MLSVIHRACARRRAPAALLAAVFAALLLAVPAAVADPGDQALPGLQARAAVARAEIVRLDRDAAAAVERYNMARVELDQVNARLIEARRDLMRSEEQADRAQLILGERLAEIYKSEDLGLLDVLLNAGDLADVGTHMEYLELVNGADADAATEFAALTRRVQYLKDGIERERDAALAREMDLRQSRADVEDKLARRKGLLADLDARVGQLVEQNARREAAAAKRLAEQSGVDLDGINGSAAQIALVRETMKYLGIPYVWGGASPSGGFDCSGLVTYVYGKFGVDLLHGATLQARSGTPVPLAGMQPGDLVFFGDASFYSHVGIFIGDGLFIEAPHTGDVVKISKLAGRGCALACRYPIRLP